jgi:hypothetical protein
MVGGRLYLVALAAGVLAALAVCGSATAGSDCATRLVTDWRDGRIDHAYPVDCYREALSSLPEDLRIYSSAESDITRALQARVRSQRLAKVPAPKLDTARSGVSKAAAPKPGTARNAVSKAVATKPETAHHGVSPFVILAVTAGLVLGAGSLLVYTR